MRFIVVWKLTPIDFITNLDRGGLPKIEYLYIFAVIKYVFAVVLYVDEFSYDKYHFEASFANP